jgi:hypothetical protein
MRTESMNPQEKAKTEEDNAGDIRKERDPKPASSLEEIGEDEEVKDKEGNLPPAMPPGV